MKSHLELSLWKLKGARVGELSPRETRARGSEWPGTYLGMIL